AYMLATAGAVVVLAAVAILLAYDRKVATIYVGAAAAVFVTLRLVASLLMAISNIYRPGALTPTIVLSLGLGLTLLVTVIEIDGNLRRQFSAALPEKAPAFYFLDIQADDADRFNAFVRDQAPQARLEEVPMLRGRIVSARGVRVEDLKPAPEAAWVLQSDRGLTYASEVPVGSRLVE